MTATFKPLSQNLSMKHALVPPPPRRPEQAAQAPAPMASLGDQHAASGHFPRQPAIPIVEPRQRISEEFYQTPPAYSAPPPPLSFAPPPVRRGTRARRQRARVLFLALFVPAVVLMFLALML